MKPERRFLDEYTWPEAYEKIAESDVAYLPVGPQEGHGRYLPMGTDIYIASAVGILASRITGGVVLHPLAYSFAGMTNAYRGTISIPIALEMKMIQAIVKNIWQQKFRAIVLVNIHGPNDEIIGLALRDLFEQERIVATCCNPYKMTDEMPCKYDGPARETALCYAALEVLGLDALIPDTHGVVDERRPPLDLPGYTNLSAGAHYTHINHHQPPRRVDVAIGRKMLQYSAAKIAASIVNLRTYSKYIEAGNNLPYQVKP